MAISFWDLVSFQMFYKATMKHIFSLTQLAYVNHTDMTERQHGFNETIIRLVSITPSQI